MVTLTHPRTTRVQGWAACGRMHMEVAVKHFLTHIGTAVILATFAALTDLPGGTRSVRLQRTGRTFVCRQATGVRRMFTERWPERGAG
jgi:hypothetical protein